MHAIAVFFTKLISKWLPDPLVVAILLTFISLIIASVFGNASLPQAIMYWGDGIWNLLAFTMQMTIILLAGYMLAKTPVVDKLLNKIVSLVKTPKKAIIMITLISAIGSWLNWGFGLVVGSIIAKKAAIKVKGLHYPLAIAAGFSGFSLYGIGLSGSVPLLIASSNHFLKDVMGVIPIQETIFSNYIIAINLAIIILLPFFNALMHPRDPSHIIEIKEEAIQEDIFDDHHTPPYFSLSNHLNNSPWVGYTLGILGLVYIVMYFAKGGSVSLNTVNFIFLILGIFLFARPNAYLRALNEAISIVAGVIVQYPFYAGIMAILVGSGIVSQFSQLFTQISSPETLPLWSFISAGIINIFIPSGGGQWAVQGPIMMEAARALHADIAATAIGVQIGDQWTNIVQPFWILPILAISGLKLKDVMGYLVLIFLFLGIIFGAGVIAWGFGL